jgi:NAD(P)H-nitrite reductase large subunit
VSVDRCTCFRVSLTELKSIADETGAGFDELAEWTQCGMGCGMCIPYIHIMLKTGRTVLPVLTSEEYMRWFREMKTAEKAKVAAQK